MSRRWYIAKSKRHQDHLLITTLRAFGVEVYYPNITLAGSGNKRKEPLFPSYIFCQVDQDSPSWPSIKWAPGLAYFLSGPRGPATLNDEVVSEIGLRVDQWNQGRYRGSLTPETKVTVTKGAFQGFEGLLLKYHPATERCIILLKIVSRSVEVELPTECVTELGHQFRI